MNNLEERQHEMRLRHRPAPKPLPPPPSKQKQQRELRKLLAPSIAAYQLRNANRVRTPPGTIKHVRTGRPRRNAKLNPEKVRTILALAQEGKSTQKEIGKQFGVSATMVGRITNGKAWLEGRNKPC